MTCTRGSSYVIKQGDTLSAIAQSQLGDGNRWSEIMKPDGTRFTEADARNLQVGQEICLPSGSSMSNKVVIYEDANYQGVSKELGEGSYDVNNLGIANDRLSSLKVPAGMKVTLYEHAGFSGQTKIFTQDASYVGDDFNDLTSSIKVETSSIKGKGNLRDMLEALGAFESGLPSGDPNQYKVENPLGFMGKYQFGEALLIDLGYYQAKIDDKGNVVYYGHGADKNYWLGTWKGKNGINSKEQFKNSPDVQEKAILEAFKLNWQRVNTALAEKGQSVKNYLGQPKTFIDGGVSKTITITLSGILAGAHLRGPYGVAILLLSGEVSYDEYGTSILRYMEEYGGYNVTPEEFS